MQLLMSAYDKSTLAEMVAIAARLGGARSATREQIFLSISRVCGGGKQRKRVPNH